MSTLINDLQVEEFFKLFVVDGFQVLWMKDFVDDRHAITLIWHHNYLKYNTCLSFLNEAKRDIAFARVDDLIVRGYVRGYMALYLSEEEE